MSTRRRNATGLWHWGAGLCILLAGLCRPADAATIQFDDPLAPRQYYHDEMNFPEAWARIYSLERRGDITVAVLDSGFQTSHPDLQGNLLPGLNIVNGSRNVEPVHPHGTGTSGIMGAQSGNDRGISQSAWTADVMPIRISNRPDGAAYLNDIANAIRFAADHGARVINISYGGVDSKEVAKAAKYAYKQGAVVFMAAGNSGFRTNWRNSKYIVAVGSVDENLDHSWFSTYGKFVDFVAPGEDITTLYTDDGYAEWSGTSFSSPIAASVASLVLTANPELTPNQVLKILKKTAIDVSDSGQSDAENRREYGYGLLDAQAAVELALQTKGKLASKYRKMGFDPYMETDWSAWASLSTGSDVLSLVGPDDLGELMVPQGFETGFTPISVSAVPEVGTGSAMMGMFMLLALSRKRRQRIPWRQR